MNHSQWRASRPPFSFSKAIFATASCFAALAYGQSIRVYSELQRIDPFGNVIQADRGSQRSREVLSPALPRNGHASFHIAVQAPAGVPYWLYIGLNPESIIQPTLYREIFEQRPNGEWVPDRLVKLDLPYNGLVPEKHIPGQSVEVFLLDVFVPRSLEAQRMKIEPQMWIPDRWIIYPMEARILPTELTTQIPNHGDIQPLDSPADFTYRSVFHAGFCATAENKAGAPPLSIRSLILRNARQDFALTAANAANFGKAAVGALLDYPTPGEWCKSPLTPRPYGPERSLRLRDRLLKERP